MKKYLLLLFLLAACTPQSICFNETPKMISEYVPGKTTTHWEGNLIITTCPGQIRNEYKANTTSECFLDGKDLNMGCPKDKYCEVDMIQGKPLPLCKSR